MVLRLPRFERVRSLFAKTPPHFFVLDIGDSSLKAALVAAQPETKTARIVQIVEQPLQFREEFLTFGTQECEQFVADTTLLLKRLSIPRGARQQKKRLVVGLSLCTAAGHNTAALFQREYPEKVVDEEELKSAVHKMALKGYEEIRKKVPAQGMPDPYIFGALFQDIKLDGKRVETPLDKSGRELHMELVMAHMPASARRVFPYLSATFGATLQAVLYEPIISCAALRAKEGEHESALLVDMGGATTRVSLSHKGKFFEEGNMFFGGNAFTRRLEGEFGVSPLAAEAMKAQYAVRGVSTAVHSRIEKTLEPEMDAFLQQLEPILKRFSTSSLLPGDMYWYGGGGNILLSNAIMKKRKWRQNLSFATPLKLRRLEPKLFSVGIEEALAVQPQHISLLALADYAAKTITKKETELEKTLKRMLNIIQE